MPRFVVLRHESPDGVHWDFMLEAGPSLKTWALDRAPESSDTVDARALPDHRLAYLEYEGPITGGRGSVVRWDQGTYELEEETTTQWTVVLEGEILRGRATVTQSADDPQRWEFSREKK